MWVFLKAQDQATHALNSFSRAVRGAGNSVRIAQLEAAAANAKSRAEALANAGASRQQVQAMQDLEASYRAEAQSLREADNAAESHRQRMRQLSQQLSATAQTAQAMGFVFTAVGVAGAIGLGKTVQTAIEYERQVRLTSTQVRELGNNLETLSAIGLKVARNIAVPFEQIQPALYDIFSSMDVSIADSEKLLTSFAKAAVAGQTDIQSVTRGTIGILNSFGISADHINHVLDIQFKLVQLGVGTYDEWASRIGLVSPSAIRAGQSLEMMAAALASASRMSGIAARAGTAVARAFDAFSNPNAIAALHSIGVEVADATGNFRPFNEVLRDFQKYLMQIPGNEARTAKIFEIFKGAGGTIEARRFLQNLLLVQGNLDNLDSILNQVTNSSGDFEKAYSTMANSAAAKTQLLHNRWKVLEQGIGEALIPTILRLVGSLNGIIERFNNLPDPVKKSIANFLLLATAATLAFGVFMLFVGAIASIVAAFVYAGSAILVTTGIIGGIILAAGLLVATFIYLKDKTYIFGSGINDLKKNFIQIRDLFIDVATSMRKSYDDHLRPALVDLEDFLLHHLEPAFETFKNKVWDDVYPKLKDLATEAKKLADEGFKAAGDALKNDIIPALRELVDWYEKNKEKIDELVQIMAAFAEASAALSAILGEPGVVGVLRLLGIFIAGDIGIIVFCISTILAWIEVIKIVWGWLKNLWDLISGLWPLLLALANVTVGAANDMRNAMLGFINSVIGAIISFINWLRSLWNTITGIFNPGAFSSLFAGAGNWLYSAGQSIVQGLIDGMLSKQGGIAGAAAGIAAQVLAHVPHSPAKKGPMSGSGSPFFAGQRIVAMLASGMTSYIGVAKNAAESVAETLTPTTMWGYNQENARNYGASAESNKTVTNNIYVTSPTTDARGLAAELGWALQGKI